MCGRPGQELSKPRLQFCETFRYTKSPFPSFFFLNQVFYLVELVRVFIDLFGRAGS